MREASSRGNSAFLELSLGYLAFGKVHTCLQQILRRLGQHVVCKDLVECACKSWMIAGENSELGEAADAGREGSLHRPNNQAHPRAKWRSQITEHFLDAHFRPCTFAFVSIHPATMDSDSSWNGSDEEYGVKKSVSRNAGARVMKKADSHLASPKAA